MLKSLVQEPAENLFLIAHLFEEELLNGST